MKPKKTVSINIKPVITKEYVYEKKIDSIIYKPEYIKEMALIDKRFALIDKRFKALYKSIFGNK